MKNIGSETVPLNGRYPTNAFPVTCEVWVDFAMMSQCAKGGNESKRSAVAR